ncbi:MAG: N(4)-(beta-N-acetylglucosaminyl)-L-asparaginase [Acidobacteria bacterium]|nr:N(4)-(beta-N-acetylglucosaminyl)-L-asparaginase [Acidobacteriota bacterium]
MKLTRRGFLGSTVSAAWISALPRLSSQEQLLPARPVVIASRNGLGATVRAMEMLRAGSGPLNGVIAGVNLVEDDPEDLTVGYGGLPNEEGDVELDASVMDGLTSRAGAVAALRNVKNPSKVARLVMEQTDHILLAGEGALQFALAMGFKKEELLTEKSRKLWLAWRQSHSDKDDWLTAEEGLTVEEKKQLAEYERHHGTIHCSALDSRGNLAGVTSTSGLAYKIPGRVGDSPIIGAGLYVDNQVGAAGATGRGEANIKICGAHTIVELMRQGKSPQQACLEALERAVKATREKRLLDDDGRPNFQLHFYAVNKRGEHAAAALWSGTPESPVQYAVFDERGNRRVDSAYLFQRKG